MTILNICTNSNFLIFLFIVKKIFLIICVIIPIILIIKEVIPGIKEKVLKETILIIILAIVILLLPLIISLVLKENECYTNSTIKGIQNVSEGIITSSIDNDIERGDITIHVGDSRTVDMCSTITGNYNACTFSKSGVLYYGDDIFIAESGMEYSWFVETAIPAVNEILESNPDVHYNIVSYMGVNDVFYNVNNYVSKYNELANGDWTGQNIVVVSVNPVNESLENSYGYEPTTEAIVEFNKILRSEIETDKIKYCDVYNEIIDTFTTWDGLHYETATYYDIYNLVKECL